MNKTKLHTENVAGNAHMAAQVINELQLADHVLSITYGGDGYCTVIFRLPLSHPYLKQVEQARQERIRAQSAGAFFGSLYRGSGG